MYKHAEDPNLTIYVGVEGAFKTKTKPANQTRGNYMLTASYIDHGLKGVPQSNLRGQQTIILRNK